MEYFQAEKQLLLDNRTIGEAARGGRMAWIHLHVGLLRGAPRGYSYSYGVWTLARSRKCFFVCVGVEWEQI